MEFEQFDDLARNLSNAGTSRRQMLRALSSVVFGSTLGGVAGRFSLAYGAEAKPKHKNAQPKHKRTSQAERKAHSRLQAEGKRKGKKHDRKSKQPPRPSCGAGEKACPGGSCVAQDQCCPGQDYCADSGTCVAQDQCCPGQRDCGGGVCVGPNGCCPAEQKCADGECYPKGVCCPGKKECGGECISDNECCDLTAPLCTECQEEAFCDNGEWKCRPKSAVCPYPDNQKVCCNGDLVCRGSNDEPGRCATYFPERTYNPAICRCQCPPTHNDSLGLCCPWDYPTASPAGDGSCVRWEDCGGYECARRVCALGFSEVAPGTCRRTT